MTMRMLVCYLWALMGVTSVHHHIVIPDVDVLNNAAHDWSKGPLPRYGKGVSPWVARALSAGGMALLNRSLVLEMIPDSPGIPGRANGDENDAEDRVDPVVSFMNDVSSEETSRLRSRAGALTPVMPWMALALYHRGILQTARPHWANNRFTSESTNTAVDGRLDFLRDLGMKKTSRVVDAGCGWGRLGRKLIDYLDPDRYFGLDIDFFELRAFIQLEIGIEAPKLITKRPRIIQSENFDFSRLLRVHKADYIVFSSVLKPTMPKALRYLALHNAATVLPPGGKVVIFPANGRVTDCGRSQYKLDSIVEKSHAFGPSKLVVEPATATKPKPVYACVYVRLDCVLGSHQPNYATKPLSFCDDLYAAKKLLAKKKEEQAEELLLGYLAVNNMTKEDFVAGKQPEDGRAR